MTAILLSSPGLGDAPWPIILLFLGVLWIIVGWLSLVAGLITGALCSRFMPRVPPLFAIIAGLAIAVIAATAAGYSSLARDLSVIPDLLIAALGTAVLTAMVCFARSRFGIGNRQSGPVL